MLAGVGLGPGDPELLTLKAIRLIREADAVFVPGRLAQRLVAPYCHPTVLEFPMTEDEEEIAVSLEKNAETIAPYARNGLAVLGILGDPNLFSTFSRLSRVMNRRYPEIRCITVPGVSAITAFSSVTGIPLDQGFAVTDGGNVVHRLILKVRHPREIAAQLVREGYTDFVLVERMFLDKMKVHCGEALPERSDYMSIMFARR